jgi:hypothetical protein
MLKIRVGELGDKKRAPWPLLVMLRNEQVDRDNDLILFTRTNPPSLPALRSLHSHPDVENVRSGLSMNMNPPLTSV